MPKTQKTNVTSITSTEESPSYKRQRMKEVRTLVARAVKKNKRVDQMGFEGTDIPRAMIALQDLLSKTQERHHKATNHISAFNTMRDFLASMLKESTANIINMQGRIGELSSALYNERMSHANTSIMLNQAHNEKRTLEEDLAAVKRSFEVLND